MKKLRTALAELEGIFGEDSNVPSFLIRKVGEAEALRIGRAAARKCIIPAHREAYARAGVRNKANQEWLDNNPPPSDYLDTDELRTLPVEEIRMHAREIAKREGENDFLTSDGSELDLLAKRAGLDRAAMLLRQLTDTFIFAGRQGGVFHVRTIVLKASRARNPGAYIAACIRNELAARLAKRKKRRRGPAKPKPRGNA